MLLIFLQFGKVRVHNKKGKAVNPLYIFPHADDPPPQEISPAGLYPPFHVDSLGDTIF